MGRVKEDYLSKLSQVHCQQCGCWLTIKEENYCAYWNNRVEAIRYGEEQPAWLCQECQQIIKPW